MPIELGLWRMDATPSRVSVTPLDKEVLLEHVIEHDVGMLRSDLLVIGRQVATNEGTYVDLLAINGDGDLVVIEVKRDRTPRDVVAQALDYASWVRDLSYDEITAIYGTYATAKGCGDVPFDQAFADAFGGAPPNVLNERHQLLIVASEMDQATERIVTYLAEGFDVPINVAFFRHFRDGDRRYLARAWLLDPHERRAASSGKGGKRAEQPWNGRDYYVSFGEGDTRRWSDAVRYGFISAGGGIWYTRTLSMLSAGDRVFVHVPQMGYVGVGEVADEVQPLDRFTVEVHGEQRPIVEADLEAPNAGKYLEDPERMEHFVRVTWLATRDVANAVWERGFFANQNSVCKLRSQFTIARVERALGLVE